MTDTENRNEPPSTTVSSSPRSAPRFFLFGGVLTVLIGIVVASTFLFLMSPPPDRKEALSAIIPEGASVSEIAQMFAKHGIVRSESIFRLYLTLTGRDRTVVPGLYLFDGPESGYRVANRIAGGDHGVVTKKLTFPEGMTREEFADIAMRELPLVSRNAFVASSCAEGYLFPDTYFFYETATSGEIAAELCANFTKKTAELKKEVERIGQDLSWGETIILASIVEEEAATPEDRRVVAGILLNRLKIGMPLQVDATFGYTIGKGSLELSENDLANRGDPYNTYRHKGLPPGAIANSGLDAITAVIHPARTEYLYYLSDKDGIMHYARTFEEHKTNKTKYVP